MASVERVSWRGLGSIFLLSFLLAGETSAVELATEPTNQLAGPEEIFSDDFESAGLFEWTDWTAGSATPFRFSDLDLRDPHLFIDLPVFGCFDFTDTALPLDFGPSFNQALSDAVTSDGDMDNLLDLSLLLLFRPLTPMAFRERVDSVRGLCSAPIGSTSCDRDPASPREILPYSGQTAGICLEPVAGTTGGYTPTVAEPGAPCFVTEAEEFSIDLNGLTIPLLAAQTAGTLSGSPVDQLTPGLLLGFLREADADALLLPADLPIVGGQPLSILLRGGTGNCSSGDDRDTFMDESGWWFYFNFTADLVPYTGP
ncbi:MAG: hypothetical protein K0U98_15090 [Deltaproteobacteria bacterium]|nr:hypothetical protein [Deltaproteobacteria bacterium]